MVKIHCDRCNKEIKDMYYTVNIYGYSTNPVCNFDTDYSVCSSSSNSNSRQSMLKMLNNTKMYCESCRDKIEAFINNA